VARLLILQVLSNYGHSACSLTGWLIFCHHVILLQYTQYIRSLLLLSVENVNGRGVFCDILYVLYPRCSYVGYCKPMLCAGRSFLWHRVYYIFIKQHVYVFVECFCNTVCRCCCWMLEADAVGWLRVFLWHPACIQGVNCLWLFFLCRHMYAKRGPLLLLNVAVSWRVLLWHCASLLNVASWCCTGLGKVVTLCIYSVCVCEGVIVTSSMYLCMLFKPVSRGVAG